MDDSVHTASIIDAPIPRVANSAVQLVPAGVAVLLNANAKRVDRPLVRALERRLDPSDIYVSRDLDEARDHVRKIQGRGYSTLLIGGGDGTIASTLRLLRDEEGPWPDLVILRLGTGNALGSLVDARSALDDVDRVLSRGTAVPTPLRVLETDGGSVFPFASLGYDAQVLNDYVDVVNSTHNPLGRRLAKSLGGYVYAVATRTIAAEVRRAPTRFRIVSAGAASLLDPESAEEVPLDRGSTLFEGVARAILVGTTPYYGFGMKVLPHAQRRMDRFHLRVSTASIPYVVRHLPAIWKGTLRTSQFLDFLVEDVSVQASQKLPLQLSGDASGHADALRVRLSEERFRLLRLR